jgi:hypothetical protein
MAPEPAPSREGDDVRAPGQLRAGAPTWVYLALVASMLASGAYGWLAARRRHDA